MDTLKTAAIRAYSERPDKHPKKNKKKRKRWIDPNWPELVLCFDTETTTDPTQRLRFGTYRVLRWTDAATLDLIEEGFILADDLGEREPETLEQLRAYVERHPSDLGPGTTIRLLSRREFVDEVLWKIGFKARALIVGFNLPFDLSRLAVHAGEGRGRHRGGFSFTLWDWMDEDLGALRPHSYRPRVQIKHRNNKSAFIRFGWTRGLDPVDRIPPGETKPNRRFSHRGYFLDLRTLAFALSNRGHSLASACEAFHARHQKGAGPEHGASTEDYLAYARQDVRATASLLEALRREFDQHPIDLRPWQAYSPASIAKAYLKAMGVKPPREKFPAVPKTVHAAFMAAYYGGRAECRIRRQEVPVLYLDFLSMYPTLNVLFRFWEVVTAGSVEVLECTEEVQAFFETMSHDDLFDPSAWPRLAFVAEVVPDGQILPVRTNWADGASSYGIGVNEVTSDVPMWYSGPDLMAAKVLGSGVPQVRRAYRIQPKGTQRGLTNVKLGGQLEVNPRSGDLFRQLIELRKGLGAQAVLSSNDRARLDQLLKTIANAGSYGIFAEFNRDEGSREKSKVEVHAPWGSTIEKHEKPEHPGTFAFPPLASVITGGARLMLAMLEAEVSQRGGAVAFCDTDSMAIVATPNGELVPCEGEQLRALSLLEVDEIVQKFTRLNPYASFELEGRSILEVEDENVAEDGTLTGASVFVISAKRYALYQRKSDGSLRFPKHPSEHGLGHVLPPQQQTRSEFAEVFWRDVLLPKEGICEPRDSELSWLDYPVVTRRSISSPELLRPFTDWNARKPYADQIKPFNFMLAAHVERIGHPVGVDPARFQLVAPYESDPRRWLGLPWRDLYSGERYRVTTEAARAPDQAGLRTFRTLALAHGSHPESKSADADGRPCDRQTRGLLRRRRIRILDRVLIGKESNRLEDVEQGLIHDLDEVLTEYTSFDEWDWLHRVVPALREFPEKDLAEWLEVSPRWVREIRSGRVIPSAQLRRQTRVWSLQTNRNEPPAR